MFKKIALCAALVGAFVACNKNKVSVTDNGLKYTIYQQDEKGRKAKEGDIVVMHLLLKSTSPKDSIINNTYKAGSPLTVQVRPSSFKGAFEEGLTLLSVGDSASFFVNADSLFASAGQGLPPFISKGSDLTFTVKILKVMNRDEFQQDMMNHQKEQVAKDDKVIQAYLAKNGIKNATKSKSGVYYITTQQGTGPVPTAGDMVKVGYTGKLLDGSVFDSSAKAGGPYEFQVGQGGVIPGWDEAFTTLKKGTKATLIIPSSMAYGSQSPGPGIPADAVLLFDVELVDAKKVK